MAGEREMGSALVVMATMRSENWIYPCGLMVMTTGFQPEGSGSIPGAD